MEPTPDLLRPLVVDYRMTSQNATRLLLMADSKEEARLMARKLISGKVTIEDLVIEQIVALKERVRKEEKMEENDQEDDFTAAEIKASDEAMLAAAEQDSDKE